MMRGLQCLEANHLNPAYECFAEGYYAARESRRASGLPPTGHLTGFSQANECEERTYDVRS
jgi:hypothetical protein